MNPHDSKNSGSKTHESDSEPKTVSGKNRKVKNKPKDTSSGDLPLKVSENKNSKSVSTPSKASTRQPQSVRNGGVSDKSRMDEALSTRGGQLKSDLGGPNSEKVLLESIKKLSTGKNSQKDGNGSRPDTLDKAPNSAGMASITRVGGDIAGVPQSTSVFEPEPWGWVQRLVGSSS